MARFGSDQNKVVGVHESGVYATAGVDDIGSIFWMGQVTDCSIDDNENKVINRYLGTASRNFDVIDQGPIDITGTITLNSQDMRFPFWAIGSVTETSGTDAAYTHIVNENATDAWQSAWTSGTDRLQAPISWTVEDSKQSPGTGANFIRTVNGCVADTVTVNATQGEKVTTEIGWIGQNLTHSSGTSKAVVEITNTPYLWSNCTLTVSGNTLETAKEINFEINNNMNAPHYVNGSRVIAAPFPGNKDYTLTVTADLVSPLADVLYTDLFKGNGTFNTTFDLDADVTATGSQHTIFFMSGCKIISMDAPSTVEGINEVTMEIRPEILVGSSFDANGTWAPYA